MREDGVTIERGKNQFCRVDVNKPGCVPRWRGHPGVGRGRLEVGRGLVASE